MLASSDYNFLMVTGDKTYNTQYFPRHSFESHMSNVTHLIPYKIFTHTHTQKKIVDSVIFYLQMINQAEKGPFTYPRVHRLLGIGWNMGMLRVLSITLLENVSTLKIF